MTRTFADTFFVSSAQNNTIMKYDGPGNGTVFASGGLLNNPNGMVFDSAGNLFVGNYHGGNILKFTPDGTGSIFAVGSNSTPYGMVFDSSGNLYVADAYDFTIKKFTPAGAVSTFATGLSYPVGVAFDGAGNLYVANYSGNSITKITPAGVKSTFANSGLNGPEGLTFDNAGNLYVANYVNGIHGAAYIERFTPSGAGSAYISGIYDPAGIAFDSSTNLFFASRGDSNSVVEISPGGSTVATYSGGSLTDPCFIAMQPNAAPVILQNPQSATVAAGSTVSFRAQASGPSLNYQWFFNDTNALSVASTNRLSLQNVHFSDAGSYKVIITNAFGSATSAPAILDVVPALDINLAPAIMLQGDIGMSLRIEYLNSMGGTNSWNPLATVTLTNTVQYYVDLSAIGQLQRLYRVVRVP